MFYTFRRRYPYRLQVRMNTRREQSLHYNKTKAIFLAYKLKESRNMTETDWEFEQSDSTVLCIDYVLNGIGSNSCGPVVMEQYRFDDTEFDFNIKVIPFVKAEK